MEVEAWSKSSLKSLLDGCSWQWALRKVYNIDDHGSPQTAMGTGVHKALEEWEKSERKLDVAEMKRIAADSSFKECKDLPMQQWFNHNTDPQQVVDYSQLAIELWSEYQMSKGGTLKGVAESRNWLSSEAYFNYDWKKFRIHGFTDSVYEEDKRTIIIDYKTAASMRRWTYEQEMNVEAAMYLALGAQARAEGTLPDKPIHFEYHVISPKEGRTRVVEMGAMTREGERILKEYLTDATAIAKRDAYRPNPDWNLCSPKYCAYFEGCRVDGTLTPYTLTPLMRHAPVADEAGVEP